MTKALKTWRSWVMEDSAHNQKDVTRDQVISAYRLFLEREPENDEVIEAKLKCDGLKNLIFEFIHSDEFLEKNQCIFDEKKTTHMDIDIAKVLLNIKTDIQSNSEREPVLEHITSQICTASQFQSPLYDKWCKSFHEEPRMHRKQWEFVYILQALEATGKLKPGMKGLGFGCGKEPLPCVMASKGIEVFASDLDEASAIKEGWSPTNQHSAKIEDLYWSNVCTRNEFNNHVRYRTVNMNKIPDDLINFDFVWSSCAFEHLGSIENGLEFVEHSMKCLKPGGIAVHTTEFNLSSNEDTFQSESLVFFRKKDIEKLIRRLILSNCHVFPLNLTNGESLEDGYIDLPPYQSLPHIKLAALGYVTTSIGLIIQKK